MNVATCFGTAMFLCKYAHTSQAVGDARDLLKISKKLNTLKLGHCNTKDINSLDHSVV